MVRDTEDHSTQLCFSSPSSVIIYEPNLHRYASPTRSTKSVNLLTASSSIFFTVLELFSLPLVVLAWTTLRGSASQSSSLLNLPPPPPSRIAIDGRFAEGSDAVLRRVRGSPLRAPLPPVLLPLQQASRVQRRHLHVQVSSQSNVFLLAGAWI